MKQTVLLTLTTLLLAPLAGLADSPATPCMDVLDRFKSAEAPKPLSQKAPGPSEKLPGEGLARHSMLYVGEGLNTIFVVAGGKVVWSYDTGKGGELDDVWMLSNGNILITSEGTETTREVDPQGKTVWEFSLAKDVPPGINFRKTQSCTRLANGNTIICSCGGTAKGGHLIEVTPDKKVVWVLQDWANLGPATAVQILNDPGVPENPGESEH